MICYNILCSSLWLIPSTFHGMWHTARFSLESTINWAQAAKLCYKHRHTLLWPWSGSASTPTALRIGVVHGSCSTSLITSVHLEYSRPLLQVVASYVRLFKGFTKVTDRNNQSKLWVYNIVGVETYGNGSIIPYSIYIYLGDLFLLLCFERDNCRGVKR